MFTVDDYIATLPEAEQQELIRIANIVKELAPEADQGISYAMPCYTYKGKALLACVSHAQFLSIYPYSGKVIDAVAPMLGGFDYTAGSVHFTLEHPLSDDIIRAIITNRMMQIDGKTH